ncbi:hypothetical protein I79_014386 [Cricetulus griseus]|uniref:Uncharacterized protein n=1 Tax=Cricetulus griseus TaxID=10029 RepID=G3HU19_CRIGR|nr:hypothetical protein I79_014386 [Cricetulus griseus]
MCPPENRVTSKCAFLTLIFGHFVLMLLTDVSFPVLASSGPAQFLLLAQKSLPSRYHYYQDAFKGSHGVLSSMCGTEYCNYLLSSTLPQKELRHQASI